MQDLIKPFRALHYNTQIISNLSKAVCPPYDVIDEKKKKKLTKQSPYNFCRITQTSSPDSYRQIAKHFDTWLKNKILVQDDVPAFYLFSEKFKFEGKNHRRIGFFCLLRVDKKGVIYPHEKTYHGPKKDRLNLLKEVKANLSPVFIIYPQRLPLLKAINAKFTKRKPFLSVTNFDSVESKIFKITDKKDIEKITNSINFQKFIIADGHHRFSVAQKYASLYKGKFKDINYTFAYLTDSSSGILVLPTHRVIKTGKTFPEVKKELEKYFTIKKTTKRSLEKRLSRQGVFCFGLYHKKTFYFFQLKSSAALDKIFKTKKSRFYRRFDAFILHNFVLKKLKLNKEKIQYTHSIKEIENMASQNTLSFLIRPTPLKDIAQAAKRGYLLPQKTTYFYPKLPSGLILRKFEK